MPLWGKFNPLPPILPSSIRLGSTPLLLPLQLGTGFFYHFFFFLLISKRGKNRGLSPLFGYLPTKMTKNTHVQQHTFFFYQSISVLYLSYYMCKDDYWPSFNCI